ncbi:hypothetical protein ACFV7R_40400 [Streptomyces sp. NPDC059866]|uniref:hypothetical protein n=1 Tax=Streptomyces sp. NPDC059866 TaxID=3346978 RepID=UPI003652955B
MSNTVMITTPARNAMEGHGLTDAQTILASDADLYPQLQGQSMTRRAVAYSVYCPATERYSLVTLDGRWIIPGREGYRTRGPVSTYARKNIADVRPDGLVIVEPVRHNGRYEVTRFGGRKAGICRRQIHRATRGGYGFECSCGAVLTPDAVRREGFTIVSDGRSGTHNVAYAVRSEHGIEWSADVAMTANAPVVVATQFRPAAEVIAEGHARKAAETAAVAESAPVPAPVAVDTPDVPADAEAPFCAPYSVAEYSGTPDVSAVGRIAYGAPKPVKRWKVVDANGRVASDGHLSRLAADTRADFLNGESGHAQTPDTCPEGTPDNVRPLVSVGAQGRAFVTGGGARLNIESADGRARFTLHTVPDEAHQEAREGFHKHARELSGEIVKRGDGRPVFKPAKVQMWSGKPAPRKAFEPKDYAPGSMLAWMVDGVRFTGQVWANRVRSGKWNGDRGECSAVVVATVDGRRARRDEAVCLPFVHGSRRKKPYAFVATQQGNADVEVIAPECASDGLFDVVATTGDPVEGWESEGGYVPGVEPADAPPQTAAPEAPEPADAPAETAAPETPAGAHCHRCDTDTVFGAECRTCGRVDIVAALMPSGPVLCPAEETAMATGRQYCPRCFTVGVALYATTLHTGPGYVCAECYTAHGRRLPEAGPAPVKAPAGDVVRAARAAPREAEESGASVGEIHRAGEAARKAVAVAYGQRPADVISDPCSVDVWEDEGGACVGVDRPSAPDAGWGAGPVGIDPSPEMGTCTAPAVDGTPVRPDVVSDPGAVDTWDGEGGAVPGIEAPRACLAGERPGTDPYAVRPAVAEWVTTPGTNRRTTTLTCAGEEYRVYHAPDAVLPYTVRRTVSGADVDLGGWVGLDDVRAIVRADRRRTAALEADRCRVEQQQRRAAYRLQGERRQAPVRLTVEKRRAIARRAEERHRPVAAELYVSPITGNAVLAFVCGTCANTHDDALWRPHTIGGRYRTPLSVERETLAALVEKRGWKVTGSWAAHGTRGDTMRAPIAPTPAYLAWVDAMYGPDPVTPKVQTGERITPVQRGWWDVVSKEGHRYELTWRPTLTGPVWSVRHRSTDGFETVATTGMATTVLTGMRVDSAERGNQAGDARDPEPVHMYRLPADGPALLAPPPGGGQEGQLLSGAAGPGATGSGRQTGGDPEDGAGGRCVAGSLENGVDHSAAGIGTCTGWRASSGRTSSTGPATSSTATTAASPFGKSCTGWSPRGSCPTPHPCTAGCPPDSRRPAATDSSPTSSTRSAKSTSRRPGRTLRRSWRTCPSGSAWTAPAGRSGRCTWRPRKTRCASC